MIAMSTRIAEENKIKEILKDRLKVEVYVSSRGEVRVTLKWDYEEIDFGSDTITFPEDNNSGYMG